MQNLRTLETRFRVVAKWRRNKIRIIRPIRTAGDERFNERETTYRDVAIDVIFTNGPK